MKGLFIIDSTWGGHHQSSDRSARNYKNIVADLDKMLSAGQDNKSYFSSFCEMAIS